MVLGVGKQSQQQGERDHLSFDLGEMNLNLLTPSTPWSLEEIKVLDILALPLFAICTEIHMVENVANRCHSKIFCLKSMNAFPLSREYKEIFLAQWETPLSLYLGDDQRKYKILSLWLIILVSALSDYRNASIDIKTLNLQNRERKKS